MTTFDDIRAQLCEPWAVDQLDFLPKGGKDSPKCLALPYASVHLYHTRLSAVVPDWSDRVEYLVAGQTLVCLVHLTICGITRSQVGEAPFSDENTATVAYSQAFRRACALFGLGAYLYDLPKTWVEYDAAARRIKGDPIALAIRLYQDAELPIRFADALLQSRYRLDGSPPHPAQARHAGSADPDQLARGRQAYADAHERTGVKPSRPAIRNPGDPITDRQLHLLKKRNADDEALEQYGKVLEDLTKGEASQLIDATTNETLIGR